VADQIDERLVRKKVRDRSFVLLVVGLILLLPPFVHIAKIDAYIFGLPLTLIYIFAVWGALIIGAAALAPGLEARTQPSPDSQASN
jgi:uncharacterized integral membrane protein